MAQITYTDKVASNSNPGVADINKVKAEDMNEIKTVVNGNYTELYNEIYYKSGDTYSETILVSSGHVTGSTATVQFSLALPKRLTNITSANITNLTARLRGISGYLNSNSSATNYVGLSGYTISSTLHGNIITIAITKSSAFTNTTNNTPVAIYLDSISISFS